jgi:hypothetical protein
LKSLLDIQQDVRELENSVQNINDSIKAISSDIESIRNADQDNIIDYDKIKILAKKLPFGTHILGNLENGIACKIYLEILLNLVRLDKNMQANVNRLVFIQWLLEQSGLDMTLEELYLDSLEMDKQAYYNFGGMVIKRYKEYLFVDAMIVANILGNANQEMYEFIADLASVLDIDNERVKILCVVARVALCQSMENIDTDILELAKGSFTQFRCYCYNHSSTMKKSIERIKSIERMRSIVVAVPENNVTNFEWKAKQMEKVNKGDTIAILEKMEIKGKKSGILFKFVINKTIYGVISSEKDNKDSIKEWIRSR